MTNVMIDIHGITMSDSFSLKAFNQSFAIALASWFDPSSESTNQFTGVFDGVNLTSSDIIDHSLGGLVEMFGNFSSFLLMCFVNEPMVPLLLVLSKLLPVDGDRDLSVV